MTAPACAGRSCRPTWGRRPRATTSPARIVPRPHSVRNGCRRCRPGSACSLSIGAAQPRLIRAAPNGDIFVADSRMGRIRVLRPAGSCELGGIFDFATGLDLPFGIAFYPPGPNPHTSMSPRTAASSAIPT